MYLLIIIYVIYFKTFFNLILIYNFLGIAVQYKMFVFYVSQRNEMSRMSEYQQRQKMAG